MMDLPILDVAFRGMKPTRSGPGGPDAMRSVLPRVKPIKVMESNGKGKEKGPEAAASSVGWDRLLFLL
jgi:hypothetical protein